jgi:hypothetical protein
MNKKTDINVKDEPPSSPAIAGFAEIVINHQRYKRDNGDWIPDT